jgi:hypothetical protein
VFTIAGISAVIIDTGNIIVIFTCRFFLTFINIVIARITLPVWLAHAFACSGVTRLGFVHRMFSVTSAGLQAVFTKRVILTPFHL